MSRKHPLLLEAKSLVNRISAINRANAHLPPKERASLPERVAAEAELKRVGEQMRAMMLAHGRSWPIPPPRR
jgi:hypothetical protein